MMLKPYFQDIYRENPTESLRLFTLALLDFLRALSTSAEYRDFFDRRLNDDIPSAWSETENRFYELMEIIPTLSPEKIDRHGLYGAPLKYKLNLIRIRELDLIERGRRGFLKYLLKAIDILLGSLLSAAGIGTAIEEFKECLENSIPEDDAV